MQPVIQLVYCNLVPVLARPADLGTHGVWTLDLKNKD